MKAINFIIALILATLCWSCSDSVDEPVMPTPINEVDKVVLQEIYQSMILNLTPYSEWDFDDYNTIKGVGFENIDGEMRVVKIELDIPYVYAIALLDEGQSFPASIGRLSYLRILTIYSGIFVSRWPIEIFDCPLEKLSLQGADFFGGTYCGLATEITPAMQNLKYLYIKGNRFDDPDYVLRFVGLCPNLQEVHIRLCHLDGEVPAFIGNYNIPIFDLAENMYSKIDLNIFLTTGCTFPDLTANPISQRIPSWVYGTDKWNENYKNIMRQLPFLIYKW